MSNKKFDFSYWSNGIFLVLQSVSEKTQLMFIRVSSGNDIIRINIRHNESTISLVSDDIQVGWIY